MKNKIIFFLTYLILLGIYNDCFGINDQPPFGARAAALGNCSVSSTDLWSIGNNQAGIGFITAPTVGFAYSNQFMIKELAVKSLGFVLPTSSGVIGTCISHFGYSNYSETKFGLGYSRVFAKKLSIGLMLDYLNAGFAGDYGRKGAITFEVSSIYKLNKNLTIGTHIYNPIQAKLDDYSGENLPLIFKFGLDYKFSEKTMLVAQVDQDLEQKTIIKGGLEYRIIPMIYLRAGMSNQPTTNTFGFGLVLKKFKLDFATAINTTLGYSPQFSMIYSFK